MSSLLNRLQALEVELHHPGIRCTRERLEQLLHPHFHEVGRSGCPYTRETVITYLASISVSPSVVSDAFLVAEMGTDVALLTFRSAQMTQDGSLEMHTLRSSVWVNTVNGWQLRYHQGTPAAEPW